MRKLVVSEFLTLDGVMQGPGGKDEDRSGGFDLGGWQMSYFDDVAAKIVIDGINEAGGYLFGRRTYDIFAGYWPKAPPEEKSVADPLNNKPKYVVSRTLREPLAWAGSHLIKGDVATQVKALKEQPGNDIMIMGSGELVQTLMKEGLVDEYFLMVHPVVLGKGKRLFRDDGAYQTLSLVSSTTTPKGVVMARYRTEQD